MSLAWLDLRGYCFARIHSLLIIVTTRALRVSFLFMHIGLTHTNITALSVGFLDHRFCCIFDEAYNAIPYTTFIALLFKSTSSQSNTRTRPRHKNKNILKNECLWLGLICVGVVSQKSKAFWSLSLQVLKATHGHVRGTRWSGVKSYSKTNVSGLAWFAWVLFRKNPQPFDHCYDTSSQGFVSFYAYRSDAY